MPLRNALLVLTALMGTAASAQTYSLVDLGTLPGSDGGWGEWISDRGEVVGTGSFPDGSLAGFVWRSGTLTAVPRLSSKAGYTLAHGISEVGTVVGEGDTGDFRPHALLMRGGKVLDFDPSAGGNARAIFVSSGGTIVGNVAKGLSGNVNAWRPTLWTEDAKKPGRFNSVALQPYPGGDPRIQYAYANAANERLQVVGALQSSLFPWRAGFWNNDAAHTLTVLQPLPGGTNTYANALNDLGQAAGSSDSTPVVWSGDAAHTPSALPLLPGDVSGGAISINNAGDAIGTSVDPMGTTRFVLWRGGVALDLQAELDASANGYTLTGVAHLNNRGQIVGSATRLGVSRAVVLTLR